MFTLNEKMIEKIEAKGFKVWDEGEEFRFEKQSSAGENFEFVVELGNSHEEFVRNALKCYDDYSIEEELQVLDDISRFETGKTIIATDELVASLEACKAIIFELYEIVLEWENEKESEDDFLTPTEKLEEYIGENFNVSGEAQRIIRNICEYAEYHFSGEDLCCFLTKMLVGTIGLTSEEIKKIVM